MLAEADPTDSGVTSLEISPMTSSDHSREVSPEAALERQSDNSATFGDFARNKPLTRSLYSKTANKYVVRENKLDIKYGDTLRRKIIHKKENDLQRATDEAIEQVEKMMHLTETLHDKNEKIGELKYYNEELEFRLKEVECELEVKTNTISDLQLMNKEFQSELLRLRQTSALQRSETEKRKVQQLVDPEHAEPGPLQRKYDAALRELKSMQAKAREYDGIVNDLENELFQLRETSADQQAQLSRAPIELDDRPKETLLAVIRRETDDRAIWQTYASKLLDKLLTLSPESIDKSREDTTGNRRRCGCAWEAFSKKLMDKVMKSAPHLLEIDISNDSSRQHGCLIDIPATESVS